MLNKLTVCFSSFILLTITSTYATSPEQTNSALASPNSIQTIIDANKGDPNAQFKLGEMYYKGNGTLQDHNEAFKWYKKAAERGHTEAQFNLGEMFFKGHGVSRDCNETLKWFTEAAKKGHTNAQYMLGEMYYTGNDIPKNYQEASKWFTMSAEGGNATAQRNLAQMYYEGKGVIEDYVVAYKWVLLAGMNGEDVVKIKQDLANKMTSGQIDEAKKLAKNFVLQKTIQNVGTPEPKLSEKETKDSLIREKQIKIIQEKDSLRRERQLKKVQEMQDAIALDEQRIIALDEQRIANFHSSVHHRGVDLDKLEKLASEIEKLLSDQEENYKQLIRSAEK